ncbi:MAG: DUF4430 domain-containing protein [Clostridia bacterium]|nr:DUF4430 domain-containing protein [Clostridia bacterium]
MENSKPVSKKSLLIACSVLLVAVLAFAAVYVLFLDKPVEGAKTITVTINVPNRDPKTVTINTDAVNLRAALEEEQLIAGTETEYGLWVSTVDGVTANDANQEWWSFSSNGVTLTTGVDDTMIKDGDVYEITLTIGW